jgi:hypothetical protein
MAVLGHELGHALGKMHDEPRVRVIPVSFVPADTPPPPSPEATPVPSTIAIADEEVIAPLALEPLPELTSPQLFAMVELVPLAERVEGLTDRAELYGGMPLRLDRGRIAPLP